MSATSFSHLTSLLLFYYFSLHTVYGGVFFKDHNPRLLSSLNSLPLVKPRELDIFAPKPGTESCLASCSSDKDCFRNKDCHICDPEAKICTTGCGLSCSKDSDCAGTKWCKSCKGIDGCPENICARKCKRDAQYNCNAKCYRNQDCHGGPCYLCGGGTCAIDK